MMTRQGLEALVIGQVGIYEWDKTLPICRLCEVSEVSMGPRTGKAFRYIEVQGDNATIGFTVQED